MCASLRNSILVRFSTVSDSISDRQDAAAHVNHGLVQLRKVGIAPRTQLRGDSSLRCHCRAASRDRIASGRTGPERKPLYSRRLSCTALGLYALLLHLLHSQRQSAFSALLAESYTLGS